MKKVNPLNEKYYPFYMDLAFVAANQSVANRRKVGAVIVLPSGLISVGWNGTPAGFNNNCEFTKGKNAGKTKPEVVHAERNAIDKLTRQGVSPEKSILFVTTAPCIECAKSIAAVGISSVHYADNYHNNDGIHFLNQCCIQVKDYSLYRSTL